MLRRLENHDGIRQGKAHYWDFGTMLKIKGVTPAGVDKIVKYVWQIQR